MTTRSLPLNSGWRFREQPREAKLGHLNLPWMDAVVPGNVHDDLIRAGVIAEPFKRMNERGVEWVDRTDWVYETTFNAELPITGRTYLRFDGIDTVAEISLNGEEIARVDNMYIPHEIDVTNSILGGENTLTVIFRSAELTGLARLEAWNAAGNDTAAWHHDGFGARSFVRKAQYTFGWDWGPVLRSCGFWQGVRLVHVADARIVTWNHSVQFEENDAAATLTFDVEIERVSSVPLFVSVNIHALVARGIALDDDLPKPVSVHIPEGETQGRAVVRIENPRRWWLNGSESDGETAHAPNLYLTTIRLIENETTADVIEAEVGLKTIEVIREPDADGKGEGFLFRVNGFDTFIKGANWIPTDSFASRLHHDATFAEGSNSHILDDRIVRLVALSRDANVNLLRMWGGGFYESEHFYQLCDQAGILVWQDFPYACAFYPDLAEYAEASRVEAIAAVKRIRVHASIALWCANNENEQLYVELWNTVPTRFLGEHLYNDILPAVVAAEDPATPYWPGSPHGGPTPQSADYGDRHNWDVWHGRGDWKFYTEDRSRFSSEFGFASSCGLGAWNDVLAPSDRTPYSAVVRWHDKTRKGYETYLDLVKLHFPDPQTIEDLVYFTQLNQLEALKYGIEHYRRIKGRCWGTIFWQLNDCWPVQSWAIIDSHIEPKAAYFGMRKFYAPILASLSQEGEEIVVTVVNDLDKPLEGTLDFRFETFKGKQLFTSTTLVSIGANKSQEVVRYDASKLAGHELDAFAHVSLSIHGHEVSDNYLFVSEPKEWKIEEHAITPICSVEENGDLLLELTADSFAPYVWLLLDDGEPLFSFDAVNEFGAECDNFFHLRAGHTKSVKIKPRKGVATPRELLEKLEITTFGNHPRTDNS